MKRTDLDYIERALANLRPHMRDAPVIVHDEWRRIVEGLGEAFAGSPWAHLHDNGAWLHGTGAEVREPSPREGEPFERDGAWYNLTESDALARGLVADPSSPRWLVPRNRGPDGSIVMDRVARQIVDPVVGEWRAMTPEEEIAYPAPGEPPREAWEGAERTTRNDYCSAESRPTRLGGRGFVCTMPPGHAGLHEAVSSRGLRYCEPWGDDAPARPAARPARVAPVRVCGDEYADDDGDIHTCTEVRGHDDEQSRNYDPDIEHSDGDITW